MNQHERSAEDALPTIAERQEDQEEMEEHKYPEAQEDREEMEEHKYPEAQEEPKRRRGRPRVYERTVNINSKVSKTYAPKAAARLAHEKICEEQALDRACIKIRGHLDRVPATTEAAKKVQD